MDDDDDDNTSNYGTAKDGPGSVNSGSDNFFSLKSKGSPRMHPTVSRQSSVASSLTTNSQELDTVSRTNTGTTTDTDSVNPSTTKSFMIDQGQYTNCGSITLAGLLIDAYKNFGQEIITKNTRIHDDRIIILLRSLSDVKVRQLLKHYMGTDKMLELLRYNKEYNTEHPQSKQLEILPIEITQFINSNEVFKNYLSEDPNFINNCIFICTLFIFFLTSFNTLQHKEDNKIQLWDENSQNFTFRLDMEALTYYTQPIYENFDQLCYIFGWNKFLTDWSNESIGLLRSYFDTIGMFKDSLNKKLTLQIKANTDGKYDMYTFELHPDLTITSTQKSIPWYYIIAISKHIIMNGQYIQFSTNVTNLHAHFASVSCHSVLLVGYNDEIFIAKNSWGDELPTLHIDLKTNLESIIRGLKDTKGDLMRHYSELFTIINKEDYDELIRLLQEEMQQKRQKEMQKERKEEIKKKFKKLKKKLDKSKKISSLPENILDLISIIRNKRLDLQKRSDILDELIEINSNKKNKNKMNIKIDNLEKEYQIEKKNINILIQELNKLLTDHARFTIPIIKGGSKKRRTKRKTIKRRTKKKNRMNIKKTINRKKQTNRKFSKRRN